jgi:hypothetical protein
LRHVLDKDGDVILKIPKAIYGLQGISRYGYGISVAGQGSKGDTKLVYEYGF